MNLTIHHRRSCIPLQCRLLRLILLIPSYIQSATITQDQALHEPTGVIIEKILDRRLSDKSHTEIIRTTNDDVHNDDNVRVDFKRNNCSALTTCSDCTTQSSRCHWCSFDSQCHVKGSIYGCTVGASCNDHNSNQTENACSTHLTCEECSWSSNFCHWCAFDNQCHAIGSLYGCTIGASCPNHDNDDADDNHNSHTDPMDKKCASHHTCTECSLSSNFCHWCAFDDKCHAIGSWYGCMNGVNCYSNDRCQRSKPEYVYNRWDFLDMGFIPLTLIIGMGATFLCCTTVLYAVAGTVVKGLYDLASSNLMDNNGSTIMVNQQQNQVGDDHDVGSMVNQAGDDRGVGSIINLEGSDVLHHSIGSSQTDDNEEVKHLVGTKTAAATFSDQQSLQSPNQQVLCTRSASTLRRNQSHGKYSRRIRCFLTTCKIWCIGTWASTTLVVFLLIYYFPKVPQYNVCSDELAWKSIIDGITSLKMEASFEILMSIHNANHLDLRVEGVNGKFKHDGDDIGTFAVKNSVIRADSITDILVTCTVVPDKWEALGLVTEYYKGTLVFDVTASGMVRVPGIGYSLPVKISDLLVPVNDAPTDRHLCRCPQWKDVKTIKPAAVQETSGFFVASSQEFLSSS